MSVDFRSNGSVRAAVYPWFAGPLASPRGASLVASTCYVDLTSDTSLAEQLHLTFFLSTYRSNEHGGYGGFILQFEQTR